VTFSGHFQPGDSVGVTIQPKFCVGSNGCYVGIPREWHADPTGIVRATFTFPTHYDFGCTGVGCAAHPAFKLGSQAEVQMCTISATSCDRKMVRLVSAPHRVVDPCISRYPSSIQKTVKIFGGTRTLYDRQASLLHVCSGFGAPDQSGFKLTPSMQCAMIAAAATYGGPVVNAGANAGCASGSIVGAYNSGHWLGAVAGVGCGYFSDIFAGGVGVFAAGATVETGPGAVAVGVSTYKALAASLKLVCGGVFQAAGTALGIKLEAKHETHVAIDVVRHGKCLNLARRFGQLHWSAATCKRL
jgi:hypothetical protein